MYSIKANPFAPVIKTIAEQGLGADAASAEEVLRAERAGITKELIFYSSPGKTEQDLRRTLGKCVLIADSFSELERIEQLCTARNLRMDVGVRVNPGFGMGKGTAAESKFGIDEEQLLSAKLCYEHLRITGIHVHLRSQVLDTDALCGYYEACYALAERLNRLPGVEINWINFGSGMGTVYDAASQQSLAWEKISRTFRQLQERNEHSLQAKFYMESGRFLVCNAGSYYTRIVDRKVSRGKTYLIVQNGLNGFLRPAVAELLRQNSGAFPENGQEPLYTSGTQSAFRILGREGNEERADVVGNLCTALDVMAKDILLPHAEAGDILEVTNAGSYGCTLSPLLFSGQEPPKEFLWEEEIGGQNAGSVNTVLQYDTEM